MLFEIIKNKEWSKLRNIVLTFIIILSLIIVFTTFVFYTKYKYIDNIFLNKQYFYNILILPLCIIVTTIIHECIHILFFIYYGKGQAKIKLSRNKKIKAITVTQTNTNIHYKNIEQIIILLSPVILITIVSAIILKYTTSYQITIYLNCILNIIGSFTDIYLFIKIAKGIYVWI